MENNFYKDDEKYLVGIQNWFIRMYFYLNNGLNIINNFRNLFLGIIAIYIALKLESIWWMVAMFIPSVAVLVIVGYYMVHKVSKLNDWLGTRFGSHYGLKAFNYNQGQYELMVEIRDLLKNK